MVWCDVIPIKLNCDMKKGLTFTRAFELKSAINTYSTLVKRSANSTLSLLVN